MAASGKKRYLYAVVNSAMMTARDMDAVEQYLNGLITETPVLLDALACRNARDVYSLLSREAACRGGTTAGVQLFGTADMVKAFEIQYKVQLTAGVKTDEPLCTDLFYGNFSNPPEMPWEDYNVREHFLKGRKAELVPQWPVARLPLEMGEFGPFMQKYAAFARQTKLQPLPKAVFYNPLFAARRPKDDMGRFLGRMRDEFAISGLQYRLYGSLKGDYPVIARVLGDFSAENMARENHEGVREYIIASHGKPDRIEACFFENREEKRLPVLDMDNIHEVLGANPYYLDAWTCLNGRGMGGNLVAAALNGQCVGMFAATAILSNNGVDWQANLADMARSNFYYFYYHYLKALHAGESRSRAFFAAQRAYAAALMEDAFRQLRAEGNVQFNLYNLLAYHNFGVLEQDASGAVG